MSNNRRDICREGIVQSCANGRVRILVTVQSACAGCHAKGVCSSFEMADKEIEACVEEPFSPGEHVFVSVNEKTAWQAVLFAFVLPMILFGLVLFGLLQKDFSEPVAGVSAIGVVGCYFLFLRIAGKTLFRTVTFQVRKISTNE